MQLRGPNVAALLARDAAERLQAGRHPGPVAELAVEQQGRVEPAHGRLVVALKLSEPAAAVQRRGPQLRRRGRAGRHRQVHPLPDLVVVAAEIGVLAELADDLQRGDGITALPGVVAGRAEVGALGVESVKLGFEFGRRRMIQLQPGARPLGEFGVIGQVGAAGLVALTRFGQPLGGVLVDRGQQVIALVLVVRPQQRLVSQPGDEVEHLGGLDVAEGRDGFRGPELEATDEYRQAAERDPLFRGEQVVGPVEGLAERLVPFRR